MKLKKNQVEKLLKNLKWQDIAILNEAKGGYDFVIPENFPEKIRKRNEKKYYNAEYCSADWFESLIKNNEEIEIDYFLEFLYLFFIMKCQNDLPKSFRHYKEFDQAIKLFEQFNMLDEEYRKILTINYSTSVEFKLSVFKKEELFEELFIKLEKFPKGGRFSAFLIEGIRTFSDTETINKAVDLLCLQEEFLNFIVNKKKYNKIFKDEPYSTSKIEHMGLPEMFFGTDPFTGKYGGSGIWSIGKNFVINHNVRKSFLTYLEKAKAEGKIYNKIIDFCQENSGKIVASEKGLQIVKEARSLKDSIGVFPFPEKEKFLKGWGVSWCISFGCFELYPIYAKSDLEKKFFEELSPKGVYGLERDGNLLIVEGSKHHEKEHLQNFPEVGDQYIFENINFSNINKIFLNGKEI